MKKIIGVLFTATLITAILCSCGGKTNDGAKTGGPITAVSREDGSGTRGAFVELLKITDAKGNDAIYDGAEITNSTSVMLTTVSGNKNSIGYVSLGSLSDSVKAVTVDGVKATVDNVKNGTYKIQRPFLICYKDGKLSDLSKDFISYILSSDGQAEVEKDGCISIGKGESYKPSGLTGKISIAGSTSVAPVMEKLADKYKSLNPGVTIEIQQSGSSAGISSAMEGVCDLGMSSRELKDSEKSLKTQQIALDGIAVIVNKANKIGNLTSDQIKSIFLGETVDWSELGE